jgi:hypothetical protein
MYSVFRIADICNRNIDLDRYQSTTWDARTTAIGWQYRSA